MGPVLGPVLRNVRAFDIRAVTVATTSTHLCVSVRFAAGMRVKKDVISRRIRVQLAPAGDRLDDLTPLAHLEFGYARGSALYGSLDSFDPEDPIRGQMTSAVTGTTVQLAVPLRWLVRIARSGTYRDRHLNPDSFFWRVSVPSDCYPGPRRLSAFPAGSSPPISKGVPADLSVRCA